MSGRVTNEQRRKLAVELFNYVWTLLEKADRTPDDDERMIHAAHASRHHWGEVGRPVNVARGEWQCSRVYACLGRAEPALHHAHRCLEWCRRAEADCEDWDLPFAYEALARAYGVAGDWDEAERYEQLARETGEQIAEDEDRRLLLGDLDALPRRA